MSLPFDDGFEDGRVIGPEVNKAVGYSKLLERGIESTTDNKQPS